MRDSTIAKLLTFAFDAAFDDNHSAAEGVFWGDRIHEATLSELQWLMESEDANIKYNSWFLFDWDPDGSGTVAELFLDENSGRLSAAEREFLKRLTRTHLRLYEVEAVHRGKGVWLADLWSGTRLYVIERTATAQIVTWDLLGGRVAPDGLGGNVFEGGLYLYPAEAKDRILAQFRRLHRRHERKFPDGDSTAFFKKHGMVFNHLWVDLVAFPEGPNVTTAEGDPIMFCRVLFDTDHAAEVAATIERQPHVRRADEARLAWIEPREEGARTIGMWTCERDRIVFEAASQERAERGRIWLERLVGDLVRYRATALETLDEGMQEIRRERPGPARRSEPPESGQELVTELYDRHYRTWLDRPVRALGNRTPRAAATTRIWRVRLLDLLKRLENDAARAALHGRPAYDFAWMWKELGLPRPGSQAGTHRLP